MPTRVEKRQRLYEFAASQAGYFTAVQARAIGYSTRAVGHHVRTGHHRLWLTIEWPWSLHRTLTARHQESRWSRRRRAARWESGETRVHPGELRGRL